MSLAAIIGVIAAIFTILALLGGGIPIFKSKETLGTIELLRSELDIEQKARIDQEKRCDQRMDAMKLKHEADITDMDRRYTAQIGELRGQITAMIPGFAKTIAHYLREELKEELSDAI